MNFLDRIEWLLVIGAVQCALATLLIIFSAAFACQSAEKCRNQGATKCDDNTVMYCTTGNEWLVENKCDAVTMLDGSQHPGQCCEGYGLSYCAEECGVSDAGN